MNLGVDAVRYSFIVMDLHHLRLAPVARRTHAITPERWCNRPAQLVDS